MEFEKKLKSRLNIGIVYIAAGIILIILYITKVIENEYLETFGIVLAVMGILRIIQYKKITKNDETIRSREIAETDERNISIMYKAKNAAFGIYAIIACLSVIVFEVMEKPEYAKFSAINVYALLAIYWVSYFIYNKRS